MKNKKNVYLDTSLNLSYGILCFLEVLAHPSICKSVCLCNYCAIVEVVNMIICQELQQKLLTFTAV